MTILEPHNPAYGCDPKIRELIIEISKLDSSKSNISDIVGNSLDWGTILILLEQHGLLQMMWHNRASFELPRHIHTLLKVNHSFHAVKAQTQYLEFFNVLKILSANNIQPIILKGVYLSAKVYKDCALRPFADMDILIRPEDTEIVFKTLVKLGYMQGEYSEDTREIIPFSRPRLAGYEHELQHFGEFRKVSSTPDLFEVFAIDVHHRLNTVFDSYTFDIEALISRSVVDDLNGNLIRRLSNEDFLIHLCSHVYWHGQSIRDIIDGRDAKLLYYTDIRHFIKSHRISWQKLFSYANEGNSITPLLHALYHCDLIYGDVIPPSVYKKLDRSRMAKLSSEIHDRWLTRDANIVIGHWKNSFLERLFATDRHQIALQAMYTEYIEPALQRGAYFQLVEPEKKQFMR